MMTLAAALVVVREHLEFIRAQAIIADAIEEAGDVAALVRQLEEEAELLRLECSTLRREKGDWS